MVRALLICLLVGCSYNATYPDCTIHCDGNTGCPEELTCGPEGLCRTGETDELCAAKVEAPSCEGLPATCGPAGDQVCCESAVVPGTAFFYRGFDTGMDDLFRDLNDPAMINDFRLDLYEVTVGRFRAFIKAGKGTRVEPPSTDAGGRALNGEQNQGGWDPMWNTQLAANPDALALALKCDATAQSWTDAVSGNEAQPINCVTWYEAAAFCAWDGGFLPTEAEWNYAAVGELARAYPWSVAAPSLILDCSFANYSACTNQATAAVGSDPKGNGYWGHADLAGNVAEWTLDSYQDAYIDPCTDCAQLTTTTARTVRGGSFLSNAVELRGARRDSADPATRSAVIGFRCARLP